MKFTKLTIQNFRGIQNLDIKDFQRVNLLVGRNNCGKTSVLEALFLISGMGNPQLPVNIHFFRDIGLTARLQLDKRLDRLIVQKNLEEIISMMREIEPTLKDIRLGANGIIYTDIGLDKLMPLNLLGNGIRRLLAIVSAVFDAKNGILLIDEIENGFHYTSLKTLWKAVCRAAQDFNVQVFTTTHSYECIEAFANSEFPEIALYRIDRTDGKHQAFFYSAEVLRAGVEKEFEVR